MPSPLTALTLDTTSTTDTLLPTAKQLSSSAPASETSVTTLVDVSTGWGELFTLGTAGAWGAGGSAPAPSGHGAIWDVTTLDGKALLYGVWTPKVKLSASSAITADIHVRAYKRSSGGTYTLLGDFSIAGQSINTTATTFLPTVQNILSQPFVTGEKIYLDYVLNITAGGVAGTTVSLYENGGSNTSIATGGYVSASSPYPVQRVSGSSGSVTTETLHFTQATTAGNTLMAYIGGEGTSPTLVKVSDLKNGNWTLVDSVATATGLIGVYIMPNALSLLSTDNVTLQCGSTMTTLRGGLTEVTGVLTSGTLLTSGHANNTAAAAAISATTAAAITNADALGYMVAMADTTSVASDALTWTSPASLLNSSQSIPPTVDGWTTVPATGSALTMAGTWATGINWLAVIVALAGTVPVVTTTGIPQQLLYL